MVFDESTPGFESLVLTEFKNNYFTKIGGTKKIHGSNSRGISHKQLFSKQEFIENFEFFGKPATFQKSNIYVPTNNLKLWSLWTLPIFSKFQDFGAKLGKQVRKILWCAFNRIIYN